MSDSVVRKCPAVRYANGRKERIEDPVAVETEVTLYLNGNKHICVSASADALKELGAGFFTASGLIQKIHSTEVRGSSVYVEAELTKHAGENEPSPLPYPGTDTVTVTADEIRDMSAALDTDIWQETGGLHSAALYYRHKKVTVFSDIARRNAVEKAVGYMALHGLPPKECILVSTGRQPQDMVEIAARAGIPVVISRAAATASGIAAADKWSITLVCFARGGRFTVYTHSERVLVDK
ncbi:MAG: formate dehydrogenase accessory sulfurtransferase FdhD [Methanocorpusculum sp.]|nr:formate dehydrogenase accessory sulfurtransferase FdhD [Methanocorpusculum sp.]